MLNTFRKFLAAPVFPEDENKTRSAHHINNVVLVSVPALLILIMVRVWLGLPLLHISNLILFVNVIVLLTVWFVMKSGFVQVAGYLSVGLIWIASTLLAATGIGIRGTSYASYFVVVMLAGLLVGVRAATGVAILSILSGFVLANAEQTGVIQFVPDPPFQNAWEYALLFIIAAVLIRLIITSLRDTLKVSMENASKLVTTNMELIRLRDDLEVRIQERTSSLEKRASQLQTVSSLARTIASVKDLNVLLPNIVGLVSEQFGFYHTGVFLIDDARSHAVLKAASSVGGQRMLARNHQLALNTESIVGYVTSRGEPRVALDVGQDAVYFNNPDLPETRSEIAVPLRVSGKVIGALDVQSTQTNAFSTDDVEVLATLADQVAIAIENAQLFGDTQKALTDARKAFERYVQQEWRTFAQQVRHTGFTFDGKQITALDTSARQETSRSTIQTGSLSLDKGKASATVSVPIKLRGQTIGILDVRSKHGVRDWSREEIMLLEAAAERAALALENARLLESAQRRAARERTIGEISSRIGSANDFNSILRATVEEMGRRIGAAEVVFELESHDDGGED